MSITVVGSSAFDDIETPRGSRKRIVGGSCIYFSLAASFKTKVNIVSVVGKDFPKKTINILNKKSIDDSLKLGLDFSMMQFWQKTFAKMNPCEC